MAGADEIVHKLIETDDPDSPESFDVKSHIDSPVARLAKNNGFHRNDRSESEERWVKELSNGRDEAWLRTTTYRQDEEPMDLRDPRGSRGGREWEFVIYTPGNPPKHEQLARANEVIMSYLLGTLLHRLATWPAGMPKPGEPGGREAFFGEALEVDDPNDFLQHFEPRFFVITKPGPRIAKKSYWGGQGPPSQETGLGYWHNSPLDAKTFTQAEANAEIDHIVQIYTSVGSSVDYALSIIGIELVSPKLLDKKRKQREAKRKKLGEARQRKVIPAAPKEEPHVAVPPVAMPPEDKPPVVLPPEDEPSAVVSHYISSGSKTDLGPYLTLLRHMRENDLDISGRVTRHSNYVHERSTDFELEFIEPPGLSPEDEAEIAMAAGQAEKMLKEEIISINRKIYRALELEWDYLNSDENVDENIEANDYRFDREGNFKCGRVAFARLNDRAKERARDWYREGITDDEWWDHTVDEWKTEIEEMGFSDVEIAFTGFSSQGDGASFTGRHFELDKWTNWFFSSKPTEQGHPYTDDLFRKQE